MGDNPDSMAQDTTDSWLSDTHTCSWSDMLLFPYEITTWDKIEHLSFKSGSFSSLPQKKTEHLSNVI